MSTPTPSPNLARYALRVAALLGGVLWFAPCTWSTAGRPDTEPAYFALAVALGLAVLLLLTRTGWRTLRRHPDLLVPFGCFQAASFALAQVPIVPSVSWFSLVDAPLQVTPPVLAALLMQLVLYSLYAAWQSLTIVQAVTSDGVDLLGELRHAARLIPRSIAIVFFGFGGAMAPLLAYVLFASLGAEPETGVLMVVMTVWTLFWGYMTCMWLPVALDQDAGLLESLGRASSAGVEIWRNRRGPLLGWALAAGLITVHTFELGNRWNHHSSMQWQVTAQWYGDYGLESNWYSKLAEAAEMPQLGFFAVPVAALFLILSIAVKITLIQHLDQRSAEPHDQAI